ncbi:MAG: hypothetical protein Tsb0034_01760 [Ekhidna sp.]
MYCIAWKYTVSSDHSNFEDAYGRTGAWFKLFEPCEDYLGHELMKSEDGRTYLLTDKWMSKEDYENFLSEHRAEYDALNTKCRDLYDVEESLGTFNILQ